MQIFNIINPFVQICPFCKEAQDNSDICFNCFSKLIFLTNACEKCQEPFEFIYESKICNKCLNEDNSFYETMQSVLIYNDFIKKLIIKFKNSHELFLKNIFAKLICNQCLILPNSCIVPIPLHESKLIQRGFNHSYFLSKEIAKITNNQCEELLIRVKNTQTQTNKTVEQQKENLKNAFVAKNFNNINNIYLIDDVITTGATIMEAAKVLKNKFSNSKIYLISLARRIKNIN